MSRSLWRIFLISSNLSTKLSPVFTIADEPDDTEDPVETIAPPDPPDPPEPLTAEAKSSITLTLAGITS